LPELLLAFRGQTSEGGITLQFALLFCRRHIFVVPQPVSCMTAGLLRMSRRLPRGLWALCLGHKNGSSCLRWAKASDPLRQASNRQC
jgi:hypothetical protein